MTYNYKNVFYVSINKGYNQIPNEIEDKSLIINEDIAEIISSII